MKYDEFIKHVRDDGAIADNDHAKEATTVTLEVLGERLVGGEPADLAAQLPAELKDLLGKHTGQAEAFDVDEFFRRIAEREGRGCTPEQASEHARAVLSTVAHSVSEGEIDNLRSQLPAGYSFLMQ